MRNACVQFPPIVEPLTIFLLLAMMSCIANRGAFAAERPHIVLVMADDQGWGEVGYQGHPILKTPHLDEMMHAGLRFDRFYAGAPVCSPTRASVMTGRTNNRAGVQSHGFALRIQEKTLAQALRNSGYRTGHFGKWHLNGMRGPGVPIYAADDHGPGVFGFEKWLSVTNFFDRDPLLSRQGEFEEFSGDSSEIVVDEALHFLGDRAAAEQPSFAVIWFGSPHNPFVATDEDIAPFSKLDRASQMHYGELVALDRSIGRLRAGLRELNIHKNTLLWYCSDNGGLPKIEPSTTGGLRGFKGSLYEGGLRVPAIVEWPAVIQRRATEFPAATMDIFPTIAEIVGLPKDSWLEPQDGMSLRKLFDGKIGQREKPLFFNYSGETAMVDNQWKLLHRKGQRDNSKRFELYELSLDPKESDNRFSPSSEVSRRLVTAMADWEESLAQSVAGKDYPEGTLMQGDPSPRNWSDVEAYSSYVEEWKKRPEYAKWLKDK